MKHLSIIVPDGQSNLSTLACLTGTYEMFHKANEFRRENGKTDLFKIQLVGITNKTDIHDGLFTVSPQVHIDDLQQTDLIIIPSLSRNFHFELASNQAFIRWMGQQYKMGAELASMCTGAFLLASAGLLNGRSCSTHWSAADAFRQRFPEVHLQIDKLITDEHGIYTNGGAYSFLNLLVYLVEKYYGRPTAIFCSKIFQIEFDRSSQSSFSIFKSQRTHGDELVEQVQDYIEKNLQEKFSAAGLSARFSVGRRNFDRRFIKATGNTPLEYSQRAKMEYAKRTFETSRKTISEVMYEVGYSDSRAFREVFKKVTGLSPIAYKLKYNRESRVPS